MTHTRGRYPEVSRLPLRLYYSQVHDNRLPLHRRTARSFAPSLARRVAACPKSPLSRIRLSNRPSVRPCARTKDRPPGSSFRPQQLALLATNVSMRRSGTQGSGGSPFRIPVLADSDTASLGRRTGRAAASSLSALSGVDPRRRCRETQHPAHRVYLSGNDGEPAKARTSSSKTHRISDGIRPPASSRCARAVLALHPVSACISQEAGVCPSSRRCG